VGADMGAREHRRGGNHLGDFSGFKPNVASFLEGLRSFEDFFEPGLFIAAPVPHLTEQELFAARLRDSKASSEILASCRNKKQNCEEMREPYHQRTPDSGPSSESHSRNR